jgi:hypothetical protein
MSTRGMKTVGIAVIAIAVAIAVYASTAADRASPVAAAAPAIAPRAAGDKNADLAARVDQLQQSVAALAAQLAAQQKGRPPTPVTSASGEAKTPEPESVEAQRAADAQRLREYMVGVEQAFANEKVDPAWASRASARVGHTFEGDEVLRTIAHTVECRAQTCRVQIEDDGVGTLNARMPYLALGLADVLPQVSAEHIDQANGRGAMVLYMSRTSSQARASGN